MPPATYATVSDLRQYLPQVEETPEADALLQVCLNRAQSVVDYALGFVFAGYASASTQSIVNDGTPVMDLPPHQAGSVASVVYGTATVSPVAYVETTAGGLAIVSPPVIGATMPFLWSSWDGIARWQRGVYAVTAAWGYGSVPDAIVQMTLEVAVNLWRGKDKGMFTDTIGVEGAGSVRYIGGLTNLQRQIIDSVRQQNRPVVL